MKTDVYRFEENIDDIDSVVGVAEKIAVYNNLDKRQALRLTLLCEELVGMLPNLLIYGKGEFWIENDHNKYEIHAVVEPNSLLSTLDRDEILSVSTTGRNAAAVGIMSKIRIAAEVLMSNYAHSVGSSGMSLPDTHYSYYNMGAAADPAAASVEWSLSKYRVEAKNNTEAWDELEKSIIANMADDVTVGILGGRVEIVIKKTF